MASQAISPLPATPSSSLSSFLEQGELMPRAVLINMVETIAAIAIKALEGLLSALNTLSASFGENDAQMHRLNREEASTVPHPNDFNGATEDAVPAPVRINFIAQKLSEFIRLLRCQITALAYHSRA